VKKYSVDLLQDLTYE